MGVDAITPVDEGGFPRAIRKAVNAIVKRINRQWQVRIADDVTAAGRVDETEDRVTIILPRSIMAGTQTHNPFEPILRKLPGGWAVGVYHLSKLLADFGDGMGNDNLINISNLLTSTKPTDTDSGWLMTGVTDIGWLYVPITSAIAEPFTWGTAVIKSLSSGSTLGPSIVNDGGSGMPTTYTPTAVSLKLWEMMDNGNGEPIFKYKWVNTPLRMEYGVFYSYDSGGGSNVVIPCAYPKPA